jgi:hypothetical protein
MNGTIPATVNIRVGSSDTKLADGTMVWPLPSKKFNHRCWMSAVFIEKS